MTLPSWTKGKKTYIMAASVVAAGVAQAFGVHVPGWIDLILLGGAIGTHRAAVSEVAADVVETKYTLQTVLDLISAPTQKEKSS